MIYSILVLCIRLILLPFSPVTRKHVATFGRCSVGCAMFGMLVECRTADAESYGNAIYIPGTTRTTTAW
ncbi:hypothetical protein ACLK19_20100 [Escherichia coli]